MYIHTSNFQLLFLFKSAWAASFLWTLQFFNQGLWVEFRIHLLLHLFSPFAHTPFLCKTSSFVYFNQLKGAFSTRKLVIITNVWTFSDFFGNIGWNELKSWKLGTPSRSWLAFVCQPVLRCSQNIVFVNRFSVIFCLKLQKHTWTQEKRYENGKKSILTSFCLLRHPKVGWNTQQPRKPSSDCTLFGFGSLKSQKEHGYPGPMFYKL